MAIETPYQAIQALEKKIRQLLDQYQVQQALIQKLQKENEQLKQGVTIKSETARNCANKQAVSTILDVLAGTQADDLGSRLKEYIKHIDACIAHFERLK